MSGLIFGIVVMVVMQIVEVISHTSQPISVAGIAGGLISHIVFFGLPIAWYVSLPYRRA